MTEGYFQTDVLTSSKLNLEIKIGVYSQNDELSAHEIVCVHENSEIDLLTLLFTLLYKARHRFGNPLNGPTSGSSRRDLKQLLGRAVHVPVVNLSCVSESFCYKSFCYTDS